MSARLRALIALPALLASVLAAAVTTDAATAPNASAATHKAHHKAHHKHAKPATPAISHARHIAMQQIGDPYKWGATGPNAFDCSGLVYYSYRHAGVSVPRTSTEQAGAARHISRNQMRPGDLMFFDDGGSVHHVAIFLHWGSGHHAVMLHAPQPGEHVQVSSPWTSQWFAGTLRGR